MIVKVTFLWPVTKESNLFECLSFTPNQIAIWDTQTNKNKTGDQLGIFST